MGDLVLIDSLKKGSELAGRVNIRDPSGVPRDLSTRVAKCSGGMIAQKIFHDFFNSELVSRAMSEPRLAKIEFFEPPSDFSKGQIDFVIRSKGDNRTLAIGETRSSFSYITGSIENVVKYAMSLLGPYVTSFKPSERTKDIHVTVIHRIRPERLITEANATGIDSYVVGGGTRQMFLDSNLTDIDNLYQEGAAYRTIKPMSKGLDAYQVIDNVISDALTRLMV